MYLKTEGLVLRLTPYKEHDAILNVLTTEHGLMSLRANGVRRSSCAIRSACQLLTYSEFTVFENRGFSTVKEASPVQMFTELRGDLEKLALASYFAQAAEVLSQEDAPGFGILPLTLNAMYALCRMQVPNLIVKAVFEFRAACLAGFTPELSGCSVCGRLCPDRFDLTNGCLRCASCPGDGFTMPVSAGSLAAMRYLAACDAKRIFSFRIEPLCAAELADLSEAYLSTRLERGFSTLDFYKSLLLT